VAMLAFYVTGGEPAFRTQQYTLFQSAYGLCAWALVLFILGLGMRVFKQVGNTAFLRYAGPAVLPFYILHQTVLFCVAYFVVRAPLPDFLKFLLIGTVSFAVILGLYEFVIRRVTFIRFLFGMKPNPPKKAGELAQAAKI